MHPFLPHTDRDIQEMLDFCGLQKPEELFADIPEDVLLKKNLPLADGLSEFEAFRLLEKTAAKNRIESVCFLGCGSYDHIIPRTVNRITSLPQFYTAYTPYQAEMSQGFLQAMFEFQTMICELTSLEVSNASLYDGHTASCEAAVMALQACRDRNKVLYAETLHPFTKQVLRTHFYGTDVVLKEVQAPSGCFSLAALEEELDDDTACFIGQSPNIFGFLEDYTGCAEALHARGAFFIISSNPLSLAVTRSQGEWGADIGIGDTQVFGLPRFFGGPSCGYIAATEKLTRKMPGRIVGQSVDTKGRRAFILTLQAREQHIKRHRATSNICSNQALAALASTVYLSLLGPEGLKETALQNMAAARYLYDRLTALPGITGYAGNPFFNEFTLQLPKPAEQVAAEILKRGILAGVPYKTLDSRGSENLLVVAVTEKRTRDELEAYAEALQEVTA
ncbi:MAG: aminomethyl-transferring glycine dehydrogenase subunit GcvPA [Spirochaetales bacterium]|nr:aminomethyl-transferring glycine dehydrogenase subunit GcvPA [Spirochaetales bacterium]